MVLPLVVRRTIEDSRKKQPLDKALEDKKAFIRGKDREEFLSFYQGKCPADACGGMGTGQASQR